MKPLLLKRAIAGVLAALVLVQATGCTSWRTVPQPWPTALDSTHARQKIKVVLGSGTMFRADSGRAGPEVLLAYHPQRTDTVPLSQVAKIQTHGFDFLKTAGLVIGLFLGTLVIAAIAVCHSSLGNCNR